MKKILIAILLIIALAPATALAKTCTCECPDVSAVTVQKDGEGRVSVWSETVRDSDDNLIQRRVETYTYKPSGEIDRIDQKTYGSKNIMIEHKKIRHYPDRQPTIEDVMQEGQL